MRTVTRKYKVFRFSELNAEAKEKVKEWFLEISSSRTDDYEDCLKGNLNEMFPESRLGVEFSLNSCQGDGVNVYGTVSAKDIIDRIDNHKGGDLLAGYENVLSEKEKKRILHYAKECGEIELPRNRRYFYCMADYTSFSELWADDLDQCGYRNIDTEVIDKFEKMVISIFFKLCSAYEKEGYSYLYEISDEEMNYLSEANEWEYLEDGSLFIV